MNGFGDNFLTGTCFSCDQHREIRFGNTHAKVFHMLDLRIIAPEICKAAFLLHLILILLFVIIQFCLSVLL